MSSSLQELIMVKAKLIKSPLTCSPHASHNRQSVNLIDALPAIIQHSICEIATPTASNFVVPRTYSPKNIGLITLQLGIRVVVQRIIMYNEKIDATYCMF